jgi:hypothetical protein
MAKLNPNKLKKLIAKGRLVPVLATTKEGKKVLLGYRRKNSRSSKSHEQYMFAEPISLEKTVDSAE